MKETSSQRQSGHQDSVSSNHWQFTLALGQSKAGIRLPVAGSTQGNQLKQQRTAHPILQEAEAQNVSIFTASHYCPPGTGRDSVSWAHIHGHKVCRIDRSVHSYSNQNLGPDQQKQRSAVPSESICTRPGGRLSYDALLQWLRRMASL